MIDLSLREETWRDVAAIREVHAAAFGRSAEGRLVDRLRNDGLIVTSLVARLRECVVANVVFSTLPIRTATDRIEAVALAPLGVRPENQRRGIGAALVREGLRVCQQRGKEAVIVVGDPAFYGRFGFSHHLAQGTKSPYFGPACMGLELTAGALRDVAASVTYPDAFGEVD